ncbi:hypothetical protein PC116_g21843 [Phytophthora cactorum]|nr:hypothetical protein PC116_g21843 [Phytophthora cactorum]
MITRNRRERANAAKVRIGVKGKEEHEAIAEALQEGIATVEWQGSRFQMCQRHLLRRQRRGQCTLSLWKCPQSQALKATPEWLTQQLDDSDNEKWDKAYTVVNTLWRICCATCIMALWRRQIDSAFPDGRRVTSTHEFVIDAEQRCKNHGGDTE